MARTNIKTHSGNKTLIRLDGKAVGLIQDLTANENYNLEAASGIGDIEVQEHVPTVASYTLTMSQMTLVDKTLISEGLHPEDAQETLEGKVFDIEMYADNGQLLRKYTDCTFESGDFRFAKHQITINNAVYKGLSTKGQMTRTV